MEERITNMDKQELGKIYELKDGKWEIKDNKCKAVHGPGINDGQRMFLDGYKHFAEDGRPIVPSTVGE